MSEMGDWSDNICAMLESEHGAEHGSFEGLRPWLNAAFFTEGSITETDLEDLCMGEETPERRQLEERYPKLTRIFESVFDGEEPFPL